MNTENYPYEDEQSELQDVAKHLKLSQRRRSILDEEPEDDDIYGYGYDDDSLDEELGFDED